MQMSINIEYLFQILILLGVLIWIIWGIALGDILLSKKEIQNIENLLAEQEKHLEIQNIRFLLEDLQMDYKAGKIDKKDFLSLQKEYLNTWSKLE